MWIPIAIPAVLFYALPRMLFDYLRNGPAGPGPGRGDAGSTGPSRPGSGGSTGPGRRRGRLITREEDDE